MRKLDEMIRAAREATEQVCVPRHVLEGLLGEAEKQARSAAAMVALWDGLKGPEYVAPRAAAPAPAPRLAAPPEPKIARAYVSPPGLPVDDRKLAQLAQRFTVKGLDKLNTAQPPALEPAPDLEPAAALPPSNVSPLRHYAHFSEDIAREFPEAVLDAVLSGTAPWRAWRDYFGGAVRSVAEACAVDPSRVYQFELKDWRAGRQPQAHHLQTMAELFGVPLEWIQAESVKPTPMARPSAQQPASHVSQIAQTAIAKPRHKPEPPPPEFARDKGLRVDLVGVTPKQFAEIARAARDTGLDLNHVLFRESNAPRVSARVVVAVERGCKGLAAKAVKMQTSANGAALHWVHGSMTSIVETLRGIENEPDARAQA